MQVIIKLCLSNNIIFNIRKIMFDIGLNKIAEIISIKSQNALTDLFRKLKPSYNQTKQSSKLFKRAPSNIQDKQTIGQPKNLYLKKLALLKQLQSVDKQIRKAKIEHSRLSLHKKTEHDQNDPQAFNRAADLVARMNQKRRLQSQTHKKQEEKMQIRIQKSLKHFKEINETQQKQKQERRLKIQQRILERKQKFKVRQQFTKRSNYLISQLQNYRISLPNISQFRSIQGEIEQKRTPKKQIQKPYPKSPFLQRIQQQQINRKRQQYIKNFQKKKIRQRQQIYGRKVRKNLKQSSLFVTD